MIFSYLNWHGFATFDFTLFNASLITTVKFVFVEVSQASVAEELPQTSLVSPFETASWNSNTL